ncbi:radical SAM protein [candidate division WWE3 bacterium]|nr:radical SAM protein [candidate division WWE3 bacterium]
MLYMLKTDVYFVRGALNGALLDTRRGNVYSINEKACQVLMGEREDSEYWKLLSDQGLSDSPGSIKRAKFSRRTPCELDFVWFEITSSKCNQSCIHCYTDSSPQTSREKQKHVDTLLTHQQWLQAIREAYNLGCKKCQFIGGEPFLYRGKGGETLRNLVSYSRDLGYNFIEVFTNGLLLTPARIAWLKELGVHVAISLYSMEASIHDCITQTPGSQRQTMSAIEEMLARDIPFRVETVLMKPNEKSVPRLQEAKKTWGVESTVDILRPTGRGDKQRFQPEFEYLAKHGLQLEPAFVIDEQTLRRNLGGNPCLQKQLVLTASGEVFPCVFARETHLGSIKKTSLAGIIEETRTQEIWNATKDGVLVCKDCEYRYVCQDCRPLAKAEAHPRGNLMSAPPPRCTYNPYTGEWAAGLWTLGNEASPFYDRTKGEEIQRLLQIK